MIITQPNHGIVSSLNELQWLTYYHAIVTSAPKNDAKTLVRRVRWSSMWLVLEALQCNYEL